MGEKTLGREWTELGSLPDTLALANQSHSSSLPWFTHLYIRTHKDG